jgi:hypothetical protein
MPVIVVMLPKLTVKNITPVTIPIIAPNKTFRTGILVKTIPKMIRPIVRLPQYDPVNNPALSSDIPRDSVRIVKSHWPNPCSNPVYKKKIITDTHTIGSFKVWRYSEEE